MSKETASCTVNVLWKADCLNLLWFYKHIFLVNPFLQSNKETSSPTVGIRTVIWEGHGSPATEEILRNLPNTNVHYGVHKIPSFVSIQNNINLAHNLPINLYKMYFNIILPFTSSTSKWYSFQIPPPRPRMHLFLSINLMCPAEITSIHFIT